MSTWHVPPASLTRYADGDAGQVERQSIDTHLLVCGHCRQALSVSRAVRPAEQAWSVIEHRIDRERGGGWLLRGVPSCLASPVLVSLTVVISFALLALVALAELIRPTSALPVLVMLAPIVPPCAVAVALRPSVDPAGPLAEATPSAGGRLPFQRAAVATTGAIGAGLLVSWVTPLGWHTTVLWLLPALTLCSVVAAAATWVDPTRVAVGGALVWAGIVWMWAYGRRGRWTVSQVESLWTDGPAAQAMLLATATVSVTVCVLRRNARPGWRSA